MIVMTAMTRAYPLVGLRARRPGRSTTSFQLPAASRSLQSLVLCALLLAQGCEAGVDIALSGAEAVTIADLNANVERLTSTVKDLTHQVEGFLAAAEAAAAEDKQQAFEARENQDARRSADRRKTGLKSALVEDGNDTDRAERDGNGDSEKGEPRGSDGGWGSGGEGGGHRDFGPAWLVMATFVHEVWLCLQHANILLNPLCQRLDRGYGVALLRKRLYWVIATVLAAYWAREILSMWMASPYASPLTLKMVVISSVYHIGKISLIYLDAKRGWSPTMGIMRLLMDHWHLSSAKDVLLCVKRVALQAFDTATHAFIVRDMLCWDEEAPGTRFGLDRTLLLVAGVWAMHAIGNLVTKKSTATVVVELAKGALGNWGSAGAKRRRKLSGSETEGRGGFFGALDGGSAEFKCTASCSHGHKRCEVCHLLTRDQPPAAPAVPPWRKRID